MEVNEGWLDANVILRYLLNDHPEHSLRARTLIERAERGGCKLKVSPHIICEVVYILEGEDYAREEIYYALRDLGRISGITFQEEDTILEALIDYRDKNVDFSDSLLAAIGRSRAEKVWTFKNILPA